MGNMCKNLKKNPRKIHSDFLEKCILCGKSSDKCLSAGYRTLDTWLYGKEPDENALYEAVGFFIPICNFCDTFKSRKSVAQKFYQNREDEDKRSQENIKKFKAEFRRVWD